MQQQFNLPSSAAAVVSWFKAIGQDQGRTYRNQDHQQRDVVSPGIRECECPECRHLASKQIGVKVKPHVAHEIK
jgi:hypothetical protein